MKWTEWFASWFGTTTKSTGSLGIGLRSALSGTAPGSWASDHREETAHNTGFNYIAVHAIAAQVAAATVTVYADGEQQQARQSRRKSLAIKFGSVALWKSTYGADDRETDPLPVNHPLVRLLKHPNRFESGANFRYRQAQQIRLTGTCLVWNVPSLSGLTCERYVIPTAMASPVSPTNQMPYGGWRISPVTTRYTPTIDQGEIECAGWYRILGQVVDARQIQVIRLPHAWYLDDGQSPLSAGAKWIDAGEAVDAARYHQLRNGVDPSVVWNLPPDVSPDQDEIDRVQAKISAKYGGPENVGRVLVAQSGTSITPLSATPKDMCYSEGFQDCKSAILALHQTPPVAVGLQEAGAYAAYNASMKAWRHAAIQPLCDMLAESDTEHLAPQFGTGLTVEIESDCVDDAELTELQLQNDLAARVRTRNEWRAVRGMPPLAGPEGEELVGESPPTKSPLDSKSRAMSYDADRRGDDQFAPDLNEDREQTSEKSSGQQRSFRLDDDFESQVYTSREQQSVDSTHPAGPPKPTHRIDRRAQLIAEILFGLFGDSKPLQDWLLTADEKSFDPAKHPRDALGRFSSVARATATETVSRLLAGDTSVVTLPEHLRELLALVPTADLERLHRQHGVEPPPRMRNALIRSVRARLWSYMELERDAFQPGVRHGKIELHIQHAEELNRRLPLWKEGNALLTSEQWGQMVGAQPGSRVHVFPTDNYGIAILVDHPDYFARRRLFRSNIENEIMLVAPTARGKGIATRALAEQVSSAAKQGFERIYAGAAGQGKMIKSETDSHFATGDDSNGYYTWARLGFHGDIRSLMRERRTSDEPELRAIAADFGKMFPGVTNVSQLMTTKQGRQWWKDYGGYFDGEFNLRKGSASRTLLTRYLSEKSRLQRKKANVADLLALPASALHQPIMSRAADATSPFWHESWTNLQQSSVEEADWLSEQDELILDAIWEELGPQFMDQSAVLVTS